MRVIGNIGIVVSVVFFLSLLFALASAGSVSIGEYAVAACGFAAFAIGLAVAAFRIRTRTGIAPGIVFSLAIVYLGSYVFALGETSRFSGNQLHVPIGVSLAAAVFVLSFSLARRARVLPDPLSGSSPMPGSVTSGSPVTPGVGVAARWMGWLTFLIGGGWWGFLTADAMVHEPSRRFAEVAVMTAGMTCILLIVPTIVLTRMAQSRGGRKLRFNLFAIVLVSAAMTWTAVYASVR